LISDEKQIKHKKLGILFNTQRNKRGAVRVDLIYPFAFYQKWNVSNILTSSFARVTTATRAGRVRLLQWSVLISI